jgi:hypothetical protein
MECCSPDVGDCHKCHPELWIQRGSSFCNWIPKETILRVKKIKTRKHHPRVSHKKTRKRN